VDVVAGEAAASLDKGVVQGVLGPRQVPQQEGAPADEAAQPRPHAMLEIARELVDGRGAQHGRCDPVLAAEPRQREDALGVVVPLGVVRRCRLDDPSPVDDQILVARRPHADHVRVEREVEGRGNPIGDRELDQLLHEPAVAAEEAKLGNDVRVRQHRAARRHATSHRRDLGIGCDDVAGTQRPEELAERAKEDLRSLTVGGAKRQDRVDPHA